MGSCVAPCFSVYDLVEAQHRSEVPPKEGGINSACSSPTPLPRHFFGATGERPNQLSAFQRSMVNGQFSFVNVVRQVLRETFVFLVSSAEGVPSGVAKLFFKAKKIRTQQPYQKSQLVKNLFPNTVGARLSAFYFHSLARPHSIQLKRGVIARIPL